MGQFDNPDDLLKSIRDNHFQTIHKLSELYKQAESIILKVKTEGTAEVNEELNNVKNLLSDSARMRDKHVESLTAQMKTFMDNIFQSSGMGGDNGHSGDIKIEKILDNMPFMKLDKEDTEKLVNMAATGSQAMLDIFSRVSQIYLDESDKLKNNQK